MAAKACDLPANLPPYSTVFWQSMVAELINLECMSLKTALQIFQEGGDEQSDIPWIVRLLENSASPIALPGKIDLFNIALL